MLEASAGIGFVTGLAVLTTAAVAMAASDFNTPPLGDISPELFFTGYFTGTTALGLIGGAIVLGTGFNNAPMAQRRDSIQKQSNSWLRPQLSPLSCSVISTSIALLFKVCWPLGDTRGSMKTYALTVCFLSFFVSTGTWSQETPEVAPPANTTNEETPEPAQPAAKAQNEPVENQTEEKEIEKTEASADTETNTEALGFSSEEELQRWEVAMKSENKATTNASHIF